jgi:hypothetical protein
VVMVTKSVTTLCKAKTKAKPNVFSKFNGISTNKTSDQKLINKQ